MKKWIVCFACAAFLTGATVASAQVAYGVKAGLDMANMSLSATTGSGTFTGDHRTGFMAGGFIEIPVLKGIAIQPEALITMKGMQYSGFTGLGVGSGTSALKLTYLDVPVLLRVDVPMRLPIVVPYVYAGPNFGFLLKAQASATGVPDQDIKRDLSTADVGLAFGGGVRFGRLLFEARYVRGLNNVFGSAITTQGLSGKNTVFKMLVGYRF